MATITEDYCSFEIAKLLKEKGFDEDCWCWYEEDGYLRESNDDFGNQSNSWHVVNDDEFNCSAPTLQMAMKWLRKVYHIEISITFGFPFIDGKVQYKYFWSVVKVCDNHLEYPMNNPNDTTCYEEIANSYEEACEAAMKYCLENLI